MLTLSMSADVASLTITQFYTHRNTYIQFYQRFIYSLKKNFKNFKKWYISTPFVAVTQVFIKPVVTLLYPWLI